MASGTLQSSSNQTIFLLLLTHKRDFRKFNLFERSVRSTPTFSECELWLGAPYVIRCVPLFEPINRINITIL